MSKLKNLVGEVLDQKYKIESQLGQGGMGAVYRATHLGTERPVALKVIMPEFMEEKRFIERFKREAKASGRLRHPNVVNVTDFGFASIDQTQLAYLVMEFLDGTTLGGLLDKQKYLPLELIVDIVEQTCLAVNEAHKLGIVHRDLKPDNIWLQPNGRGGYNVKVLDFGLAQLHDLAANPQQLIVSIANDGGNSNIPISLEAKTQVNLSSNNNPSGLKTEITEAATIIAPPSLVSTEAKTLVSLEEAKTLVNTQEAKTLINPNRTTHDPNKAKGTNPLALDMEKITQVGSILGTPLYMSPEQCQGLPLDFRTDIYSLGVIVYQMFTGTTPFTGNLYELLKKHVHETPPPLTQKEHKVPPAIAKVVMSALEKKAENRPISAITFAEGLRANSQGELPLLREALSLYRKHFGTFFKTSCLVYLPYLIFNFLLIGIFIVVPNNLLSNKLRHILIGWYWLFGLGILLFANTTNLGIFALVLKQVQDLSKPSISLFEIFKAYIRNFHRVVFTALFGNVLILLDYALCTPIVLLENKTGKEALEHSKFLVNQLKPTMIALQIRSIFISALTLLSSPIIFVIVSLFCFVLNENWANNLIEKGTVKAFFFVPTTFLFFPGIFLILVYPIVAIATTLFYFKVKAINGEDLVSNSSKINTYQVTNPFQSKRSTQKRAFAFASVLVIVLVGWLAIKNIALTFATGLGLTNVVETLILVGANANAKINISAFNSDFEFNTTPLIHAVSNAKDKPEIVKILLDNGADVNSVNDFGWTPLMEATSRNNLDVIKMLVDNGANINAADNQFYTCLMKAVSQGNLPIVKFFLEKQVEVNALNTYQESALLLSVASGNAYITKALLDKDAEVNVADSKANTPLMFAAKGGDSYIVSLLIKKGAEINQQNDRGQTPLIIAVINNNKEVVKQLIDAGAKTNFQDKNSKTALDYAKEKNYKEIVDFLEKDQTPSK